MRFSAATQQVVESQSAATVTLVRTGSAAASVTVSVLESATSAIVGEHFAAFQARTVALNAESTTFSVALRNSPYYDVADRVITLQLSQPSVGLSIGAPSTHEVLLLDDGDRECRGLGARARS